MRYSFQDHVLDTGRRELRRDGEVVPATRQVVEILEYLIRNRDRLVSKDDLIDAIWQGRAISDSALTTRVNAVRRAIGDSGETQSLIKTAIGLGYRFVGGVQEAGDARPAVVQTSDPGNPSISVRRFTSDPGAADRAMLADGIAEDVLLELTGTHWLSVTAGGPREPHTAVPLGVRYVLGGNTREMGDRIRVTGSLADTETGMLIWGGRYDLHPAGSIGAYDDVTQGMAAAVARAILNAEQRRALRKPPDDLGAWEAYQRGMWHMSNCEPDENLLAQAFFRQAIERDPAYAAGHGALGWTYMMAASIFSQMSIEEGCALAEPLVRKAAMLDENDTDSRARLAIAAMLRGDLEHAFDSARKILSVNPNSAEALGVKGTALLYSGRRQEGREAILRHLSLSPHDPARPIRLSQIAASLYLDGKYEAALATARRVVRRYPKHPTAYRWIAASLGQLDRPDDATDALRDLCVIAPSSLDMYVRQRPRYCGIEYGPLLEGLSKAGWRD